MLGDYTRAMRKSRTVWKSFGYALSGIRYAAKRERNMRLHLAAAAGASLLGFFCRLSGVEWMALILVCMAVIMAELFNTAMEAIVDLVAPEFHPLAKAAKDAAAGAVLIAAAAAAIVGFLLFFDKIFG